MQDSFGAALGGTWVTIVLATFWLVERGNRKEIGNILKRGSGHGRKASGIIGGTRQASEIIGRDDIIKHKGRTFELLLYNSQTWTYMCKRVRQVRHVREKRVPTQCANQNACAVPKIEKGCKKGRIELTTLGCWKRGKPVLTLTSCASAFGT